jgi:hypothetical protein
MLFARICHRISFSAFDSFDFVMISHGWNVRNECFEMTEKDWRQAAYIRVSFVWDDHWVNSLIGNCNESWIQMIFQFHSLSKWLVLVQFFVVACTLLLVSF